MLSSSDRSGNGARCRELGVAGYVTKPVKQSDLLDAIVTALRLSLLHPPEPAPALPAAAASSGQRLHVLLAEDNVVNQKVAAQILTRRGH